MKVTPADRDLWMRTRAPACVRIKMEGQAFTLGEHVDNCINAHAAPPHGRRRISDGEMAQHNVMAFLRGVARRHEDAVSYLFRLTEQPTITGTAGEKRVACSKRWACRLLRQRLPRSVRTRSDLQQLVDVLVGLLGMGYHPDTGANEYTGDFFNRPFFDARTARLIDRLHGEAIARFGDAVYELGVARFARIDGDTESSH